MGIENQIRALVKQARKDVNIDVNLNVTIEDFDKFIEQLIQLVHDNLPWYAKLKW